MQKEARENSPALPNPAPQVVAIRSSDQHLGNSYGRPICRLQGATRTVPTSIHHWFSLSSPLSVPVSTTEKTAVNKLIGKYLGVTAGTAALALFAFGASAQEKKVTPAPAPKTAAKTTKPPTCNSLKDEAACKARSDCNFVPESKDAKSSKVKRKAYCRSNPTPAKKVDPAKK